MSKKIKVAIESQERTKEPTKKEYSRIKEELKITGDEIVKKQKMITVDEFIEEVTKGKSFCGAIFHREKFKSMQVFVLEFDDEADVLFSRGNQDEFKIAETFTYETFLDVEYNSFDNNRSYYECYENEYEREIEKKYRIVFVLEDAFTDIGTAHRFANMLCDLFDANKNCRNIKHIWSGGSRKVGGEAYLLTWEDIENICVAWGLRHLYK